MSVIRIVTFKRSLDTRSIKTAKFCPQTHCMYTNFSPERNELLEPMKWGNVLCTIYKTGAAVFCQI
jgi:hypothetical protein